ncbi:MAG TPA: hypothetical protein VFW87_12005 [Pirellulales bacterium]|nr:hypothetical protein [Pirellulales bacterium]
MRRAARHLGCGCSLLLLALAAAGRAEQAELPPGVTLSDSPAESRLLAQWQAGKTDGQWLFEAALAAGDAVDEVSRARYLRNWHHWLATLRQTTAVHAQRRQAEIVFEYLHRNVLRGGYQDDCTDLANTLAGGGYNCVGATILFNSLADALGLSVHAIETPEHVYSVVATPAGPLEVEMTCRRWFEVIDDQDKRRAAVEQTLGKPAPIQASARRLSPAALVALIYYNAGVDALADERFAEAACQNLKALRLDPTNRLARGNLLATLNNWALAHARRHEYSQAVALLTYGRQMDAEHAPFRSNLIALYQRWFDDLAARGQAAEAQAVLSRFRNELPGEELRRLGTGRDQQRPL